MNSPDTDIQLRIVTSALLHYRISLQDGTTSPGRTAANRHLITWLKNAQKSRRFGLAGKDTLNLLLAHAVKNQMKGSVVDELEQLVAPATARRAQGDETPDLLRLKAAGEALAEQGFTVKIPYVHDFSAGQPDLSVPTALVLAEDMACFDEKGALTEAISLVTVTEAQPEGVVALFQEHELTLVQHAQAFPEGAVQTEFRLSPGCDHRQK